jgi:hypothetical protein
MSAASSPPLARAKPRFRLTAPVVPEHPRQKAIAHMLRLELAPAGKVSRHGVVWYSIDHANYAGEVPGVRLDRGIIAGILDTFLLYAGRAHLIEIKTDAGELSAAQQSVASAVLVAGGKVGIVRDHIETLACLDEWKIPRSGKFRGAA